MMNGLLLIYKKPQKWNKSQSIENYFKSIIIQTIEFISCQFGTVKNSKFGGQDPHSNQEKVHGKDVKNLQNNFSFLFIENMKMVGFPKRKTFRNSMTDQDLGLILASINLICVLISNFGLGFLLLIFNCFFMRKWLTR